MSRLALAALALVCVIANVSASLAAEPAAPGDQLLAEYFSLKTQELTDRCLADVQTPEDWSARWGEYRRQLQEMLGLDPWPERSELKPVVTGTLEHGDIIVEKLHFQSLPGLYVTGNLYRPKAVSGRLPAILYVCGHSVVKEGGVSFGNKAGYHHHGVWFARNGYVCLTIDTIQLGEIEGLHHGMYREGMWWWLGRGYTPAGVEAWNGIRALDYLQSRGDVDPGKIGMTGRSGGGATTWWVSALDERVKASVPVAGITSLKNHVVDGCVEGHCDCMYYMNTYGWDFPLLAALVAPRPLLISNTDKDKIFPLDGVVDVYNKARRIYKLAGAEDKIGLCIAEGPHKDLQELQVDAFHWLNRYLKNDDPPITLAAEKVFAPAQLKVFAQLPADQRVTSVQEWFVPEGKSEGESSPAARKEETAFLQEQCFRGLDAAALSRSPEVVLRETRTSGAWRLRTFEFAGEDPYRLTLLAVDQPAAQQRRLRLTVLDQAGWEQTQQALQRNLADAGAPEACTVYFAPRGVGPTAWTSDPKKETHIRRRFALLGTTEDRVRIEDVIRAAAAARAALDAPNLPLELSGEGPAAGWALHAGLFVPGLESLKLTNLSADYRHGPYLMNVQKRLTLDDTVRLVRGRVSDLTLSPTAGN